MTSIEESEAEESLEAKITEGPSISAGTPLVTAIVVCYHRAEDLRRLLAQLEDPRVQVVVVNAEIDPEVADVASSVMHVPLDGDPGWATGMNLGARHALSDYVVLLNDDLEIDVDTLLSLRDAVASHMGDVVVPATLDSMGQPEATIKALPTPRALVRELLLLPDHPVSWLRGRVHVEKWRQPTGPERVEACGAPALATTRALLEEIPLPEDYFLYWDEIKWQWDLRDRGKSIVYLPSLQVRHLGGRAAPPSSFKFRLITRNGVRCVRQTQGRRAAFLAFVIIFLYNCRLVAIAAVRQMLGGPKVDRALKARMGGLAATSESFRQLK